jgi:L-alanine-DL-glutamate epimerase-like enolase superfamily enzyme
MFYEYRLNKPTMEKGQMVAPQAPGLGLSLNEVAVQRYRL